MNLRSEIDKVYEYIELDWVAARRTTPHAVADRDTEIETETQGQTTNSRKQTVRHIL